ncbi:hypothetical protein [Cohnella massiliensis]|uniref:hypothetical protein n=1 Tax=Cohnella massiliensis TaxID=1816691 RepID=UPI0009BA575B|nr:hypothetical protein [Cohnella massiliensis]
MKNIFYVLRDYAEDILIGAGLLIINIATFRLHEIAGLFGLGVTLLLVGFATARNPPKKE